MSKNNKIKLGVAVALLLATALYFVLYATLGCNQSNLVEYLEKNEIRTQLPSGAELTYASVEKDRGAAHVICNAYIAIDGDADKWITLSLSQQKADLKAVGDLAIKYIKSKKWDNSCNLYVTKSFGADYFVYNYETEVMYYPENIDFLCSMYETFGESFYHNLIGDPEGEAFLLKNGLATEKQGEAEMGSIPMSYTVFIYNGKFKEFGSSPYYTN